MLGIVLRGGRAASPSASVIQNTRCILMVPKVDQVSLIGLIAEWVTLDQRTVLRRVIHLCIRMQEIVIGMEMEAEGGIEGFEFQ
jgi:hypothetical protein